MNMRLRTTDCELIKSAVGSHSEFIDHVHLLEKKKAEKLRVAELWYNYQIACIENYFKAEKDAAEHDFTVSVRNKY